LAVTSDTRGVRDVVRVFEEAVEALNRVDLAQLRRLVDPEIAFIPMRSAVTGAYMGHTGLEQFLSENDEMYEMFRAEFDSLEPLPDGRLLCIGRIKVRGHGGETETEVATAGIAVFRGDRLLSWRDYGDETRARAVAAER
jgi:limonene-1,2-epoxide hydrolase